MPFIGRPSTSTMLVASFTVLPTPTDDWLGETWTDAEGGRVYSAAVRSVTSDPLLFASVPAQAAAARRSAVSTGVVLEFTDGPR